MGGTGGAAKAAVTLEFVPGPVNVEDVARIPGTPWLVGSGMTSRSHPTGALHLIDTAAMTWRRVAPDARRPRPDATYGEAPPPDPDAFDAHGVALRPGDDGVHTLYVVNHGGREAIEVFAVDARGEAPELTWVGGVLQDENVWGNACAPLPDGGIVATNYLDLTDAEAFDKVYAGRVTGNLKEWHAGEGWIDVPGSEMSAPNGVEASSDGAWLFANSWAARKVIRVARPGRPAARAEVDVDLLPDNVKWGADGRLLIAGHRSVPADVFAAFNDGDIANVPWTVIRVDPESLAVEEVARVDHETFGCVATGLDVGDDLWVASPRSDRVGVLRGLGA